MSAFVKGLELPNRSVWYFWLLMAVYWGPRVHTDSPWLQSAAFVLLAFASTTVESSLMINLKILTSKGMLVQRSGSVQSKHLHFLMIKLRLSAVSLFKFKIIQRLTLCRFGACADAVVWTVDFFSFHHNVLETFIISVETVLQQLAESHRAAGIQKSTFEWTHSYTSFLHSIWPLFTHSYKHFFKNAWVLSPWCSLLQIQSITDKAKSLCIQVLSQIHLSLIPITFKTQRSLNSKVKVFMFWHDTCSSFFHCRPK